MTGYQSKKAAARDKLEQDAFDAWWDTRPRLNKTNPAMPDSFEYWAWEGWHAALAQPEQKRQWIWLSDADIAEVIDTTCQYTGGYEEYLIKKAERKIRSMNNGT